MVFADISGFTALTERLSTRGREGAELVTALLDITFSEMLDRAEALGGDLIHFGGDALCLFFDAVEGTDHASRGVGAAHAMRSSLRATAPNRRAIAPNQLGISIGVHSGRFLFLAVGERFPLLVTLGPDMRRTLTLEKHARRGQILLSSEAALVVGSQVRTRPSNESADEHELVAFAPQRSRRRPPRQSADAPSPSLLHPDVATMLSDGSALGRNEPLEHRFVAVAFIGLRITGMADEPGLAQRLHQLVRRIDEASQPRGAELLSVDVDVDGCKLIVTCGALRSPGEVEDRMLGVASDLRDTLGDDAKLRIGIHAGASFVGPIGSLSRRCFTIIGDAINTAARIAADAEEGELAASLTVIGGARERWVTRPRAVFAAKGKRDSIITASVLGVDRSPFEHGRGANTTRDRLPFIGRASELQAVRRFVTDAQRANVLAIRGAPGTGKTRLWAEAVRGLEDEISFVAEGSPNLTNLAYGALRYDLRRAFGCPTLEDLQTLIASEPPLVQWAAVIAEPFGWHVDDNRVTARLSPDLRRQRAAAALCSLAAARGVRGIIVVDDAHNLDRSSEELLGGLLEQLECPWSVVALWRSGERSLQLPERPGRVLVDLPPLSRDEVTRAAVAYAERFDVDVPDLADLADRVAGNPLHLDLLLDAMQGGEPMSALPPTIEQLAAMRLDRLSPTQRDVLSLASVQGMEVDLSTLKVCARTWAPTSRHRFVAELESELEKLGDEFAPIAAGRLRFRSALTRDAAYERLPFRLRRSMHLSVAEEWERAGRGEARDAARLTDQFHAAGRLADVVRIGHQAALHLRRSAPHEAVHHAELALSAARQLRQSPEQVAELSGLLGEVAHGAGLLALAENSFRQHLRDSQPATADAMLRLGRVIADRKRLSGALRWYSRAAQLADGPGSDNVSRRAQIRVDQAGIRYRQGKHRAAERLLSEACSLAELVNDRAALAWAHRTFGPVLTELGRPYANEHLARALQIYRELDDIVGEMKTRTGLGVNAHLSGDWGEAAAQYQAASVLASSLGDRRAEALYANNLAEIASDRGDLSLAEQEFRRARAIWRNLGYQIGQALATSNLGRVMTRSGRLDESDELLRSAADGFARIGADDLLVEVRVRQAELLVTLGRNREALALVEATRVQLRGPSQIATRRAQLARVAGLAHAGLGDFTKARIELGASVNVAERTGAQYEAACSLAALGPLDPVDGAKFTQQANETFDRLAVQPSARRPIGLRNEHTGPR